MTELTLPQKNSILAVVHEYLSHPSSIDHAVTSISTAAHVDSNLVRGYLSSLYDLDALFAARAGQKADEALESPSKRAKSSPLKNSIKPIELVESAPVTFQLEATELPPIIEHPVEQSGKPDEYIADEDDHEEEQDEVADEMMEDQPEDEPEEEPEEPKRSSRSRRSSSSAVLPEVLVTPVKRPRRR